MLDVLSFIRGDEHGTEWTLEHFLSLSHHAVYHSFVPGQAGTVLGGEAAQRALPESVLQDGFRESYSTRVCFLRCSAGVTKSQSFGGDVTADKSLHLLHTSDPLFTRSSRTR